MMRIKAKIESENPDGEFKNFRKQTPK